MLKNYVETILKACMLLLPFHEIEVTDEDRHVIVRLHVTVRLRLVCVLVILDPDPLVVVMVEEVGTPGHCDAHPGQPLNHSVVGRARVPLWLLSVCCSQSLSVQRHQCNSFCTFIIPRCILIGD